MLSIPSGCPALSPRRIAAHASAQGRYGEARSMLQKHDPGRVSVASGPPTCEVALCFGRVIILSPLLIPGPLPGAAPNAGGKTGTARVTEAAAVTDAGPPARGQPARR